MVDNAFFRVLPRRIVVVDREAVFRSDLVRRLLLDGHEAYSAADTLTAFRLARWLKLDTAMVGDPADMATDKAFGVLRYLVAFVVRISDQRLVQHNDINIVRPRAVDFDALCPVLGDGRVAATKVMTDRESDAADSCKEKIRLGMRCERERDHGGLHRWRSPDAGRSFVWG